VVVPRSPGLTLLPPDSLTDVLEPIRRLVERGTTGTTGWSNVT